MEPETYTEEFVVESPIVDDLINALCGPTEAVSPLSIERKSWTPDEIAWLLELSKVLPRRWRAIAAYFPGRSEDSVRNAFHRFISKTSARAKSRNPASPSMRAMWTPDEDARLRNAISDCTIDGRIRWASVALRLGRKRGARSARGRAERLRQMDN